MPYDRADPPSVHELPADILVLIFSHAPTRARLRCHSLVCRRWRTAALRSVTAATFYHQSSQSWTISRLHKLLPALTDLTIAEYCPARFTLTALRRLALDGFVVLRLLDDENRTQGSTLLSASFPSLSSLSLCVTSAVDVALHSAGCCFTPEDNPIIYLISRHASQLEALSFASHCAPLTRAFCSLHFPSLTALTYTSSCRADLEVLHSVPQLASLELSAGAEILRVPTSLLRPLTRLHPLMPLTEDEWHRLRAALPALQPPLTHRTLKGATDTWRTLAAHRNVTHLEIYPIRLGPLVGVQLPYLVHLSLTDQREGWEVSDALSVCARILEQCRTLHSVSLTISGTLSTRQRKQLSHLVTDAMQQGVREVSLDIRPPATLRIPAAECGWVDVRVAQGGRFRLLRHKE